MPIKRHVDPSANPLPNVVRTYLDAGWTGVLPLPEGQKFPPPSGFTGSQDDPPSHAALWDGTVGTFNVALRAPVGVIGLDVDTYEGKQGHTQLTSLILAHGPLPDTHISSSRDHKYSGIRWFRVPADVRFPGNIAPDIEVIQRHHRYAVVFPSVVDEREYTWSQGRIPRVDELPFLPDNWVKALRNGTTNAPKTSSSGLKQFTAAGVGLTMSVATAREKLGRMTERFYATMPGNGYNQELYRFSKDMANYVIGMGFDEFAGWEKLVEKVRAHPAYGDVWDGIDSQDEGTMRSGFTAGVGDPWDIDTDDSAPESLADTAEFKPLLSRMQTPTIEVVDYLWKGGILGGAITLLAGPPGTGKSTFTYALAAEVTRGEVQGDYYGEPGYVIICSTEDSPAKAIVPRLTVHGADFDKILWVQLDGGFTFPEDVERMRGEIGQLDAPVRLMVLDPLVNRLSNDTNTYKDSDVRKALEPVQAMCEEEDIAVLGIMHNNKATDTDPLNNISGAVAFGGVARAVLTLSKAEDYEETGERTIGIVKNNYGSDTLPSYRFRTDSVEIEPTVKHRKGKKATTSKLVWVKKSDVTQSEEVTARRRKERQQREDKAEDTRAPQLRHAEDWIISALTDGKKSRGELDHMAKSSSGGPSTATLGRALKQLKEEGTIVSNHGVWELPTMGFKDSVERLGELPNGVQLPGHPYGGVARHKPTEAGIAMIRHYAENNADSIALAYLEELNS